MQISLLLVDNYTNIKVLDKEFIYSNILELTSISQTNVLSIDILKSNALLLEWRESYVFVELSWISRTLF